jgi:hypothetical protein
MSVVTVYRVSGSMRSVKRPPTTAMGASCSNSRVSSPGAPKAQCVRHSCSVAAFAGAPTRVKVAVSAATSYSGSAGRQQGEWSRDIFSITIEKSPVAKFCRVR